MMIRPARSSASSFPVSSLSLPSKKNFFFKLPARKTALHHLPLLFPPWKIDSRKNYLLSKNLLILKAYMVPRKTSPRKPLEKWIRRKIPKMKNKFYIIVVLSLLYLVFLRE